MSPADTMSTISHRDSARDAAGDELYVGYLPAAPPRVARFVRRLAPLLVLGGLALGAALAALQGRFAPGVFAYGTASTIEGTLHERPYPLVVTGAPASPAGDAAGGSSAGAALLVRQGKHGAAPDAAGLDGRRVRLEATRIESPLGSMLELVPGTLEPAGADGLPGAAAAPPEVLGRVEVSGEIVDSKCFLGVMKPGQGKPHRSCAARCLSGGIPPALLVESRDGSRRLLLLAGADGGPLARESFLDLVGEPVVARGAVERRTGLLVLRLDEGGLRRR